MGLFSLFGGCSEKPEDNFRIGDKELFVRGWTDAELREIISDFEQIYRDGLPSNFSVEVHVHDRGALKVTFPVDIEPRFFCWLVNYVQYPKGLDFLARPIVVVGKATITSDFLPSSQSLIGKRMTFYIPADDNGYDVVFGRVDSQSYEFPFGSERWRRVQDPRLPTRLSDL
jgi:hypothetical protein